MPIVDLHWELTPHYYGWDWFFLSLPNWIVFGVLLLAVVAAILAPIPRRMVD